MFFIYFGLQTAPRIYDGSKGVTVNGGAGNDTILNTNWLAGNVYEYSSGDGNDVIVGMTSSDTLLISGTTYSTAKSGDNVIVTAGSGKITLEGAASLSSYKIATVKGSSTDTTPSGEDTVPSEDTTPSGDTIISNTKASASVVGTSSADTIKNTGAKASVYGYAGNDSIYNSASSVKVYSGDGNDTINSSGSSVYLDGGAGTDKITISGTGTKNTIYGGAGNDTIYSSNTSGLIYLYAKGDGNDVINGWTAKDTLSITGGAYKLSTVGNNVKVSITGGSAITLVGAKGKTVNVKSASSSTSSIISNTKASASVVGTSSADTIKNTQSTIQQAR